MTDPLTHPTTHPTTADSPASPAPTNGLPSGPSGSTSPSGPSDPVDHPAGPRARAARVLRGHPEDPVWARPALAALLLGTLVLYLWDLSASGYANSFYSAAVQAGSQSWKAFFFGSSDAANSITVDKPPAALWPMALSVRLFGLGSWQILAPEALMGVATVGVLYAAVRRVAGAGAGLLAGAVLAVTPVAALMFRFNNPDALLALLMVVAVHAVLRATEPAERGRARWLVLAGAVFGAAFLTKTLQAWLIVPPLAVVYAVCGPARLPRRLLNLLWAGLAMLLAGGWWVAIVELWPASSRPYIGGSQDNSFLGLTFGYNGFGRITGNETGSVGGGGGPGGGGGQWGATGVGRMFGTDIGGQIAWLLPAALLFLVAGLVLTARARRTDATRAAFLAWGGALLATLVTFSFMSGIFHQYYTIALAPYVAALVGMGAALLWRRRTDVNAAIVLAAAAAGTGLWSYDLLDRSPDWHPWLRTAVVVAGLAAALGLLAGAVPWRGRAASRFGARAAAVAAVAGLAAALGGPVAYTLDTVGTGHEGSIVTAGPALQVGFPGGNLRRGFAGNGRVPVGGFPGGGPGGGMPGMQQGQQQGRFPGAPGNGGTADGGSQQTFGRPGGGGMGGLLDGTRVSAATTSLLLADADRYTWVAAAIGSQNQASYQLATGRPVMSVGGFNGSDPSPTLRQFQKYVAQGRIHYFIAGGGGPGAVGDAAGGFGGRGGAGGFGRSGTAAEISSWVTAHFTSRTVGGTTVYDLTSPTP